MLDRWRRALGCGEPTVVSHDKGVEEVRYTPGAGSVEFLAYMVEGLGHHWPGGKGRFNPRIAGPPSDRVNGTELVWEFFKEIA